MILVTVGFIPISYNTIKVKKCVLFKLGWRSIESCPKNAMMFKTAIRDAVKKISVSIKHFLTFSKATLHLF